jgi:hypothetical protein
VLWNNKHRITGCTSTHVPPGNDTVDYCVGHINSTHVFFLQVVKVAGYVLYVKNYVRCLSCNVESLRLIVRRADNLTAPMCPLFTNAGILRLLEP